MNVLELFAGSRSIGKQAEKLGMNVYSSDINDFEGIDYVVNILEFDVTKVPFKPDIIWASPPCTSFSVASIGHHWTGGKGAYIPKTDGARLGLELVKKTIEIIEYFQPTFWFMENPRGVLRKLPVVQGLPRKTVTYCQYGLIVLFGNQDQCVRMVTLVMSQHQEEVEQEHKAEVTHMKEVRYQMNFVLKY